MRVSSRLSRIVAAGAAAAAGFVFAAGAAFAVSGGGYGPSQQDCPPNADSTGAPASPSATPPGCHNLAVNVESGGTTNGDANSNNTRYVEFGNDQSPNMDNNPSFGQEFNIGDPGTSTSPHSGCLAANTAGTGGGTGTGCGNNTKGAGFSATWDYYQLYCPATAAIPLDSIPVNSTAPAPKNCSSDQPIGANNLTPDTGTDSKLGDLMTKGLLVYLGADDNLDNGEHDGVTGANNTDEAVTGPSDGGAVTLSLTPQNAARTPSGHNPEGLANASSGACADGICAEGTTQQQTVYHGCSANETHQSGPDGTGQKCANGTPKSGDVYQNGSPASTTESPNCQSGNTTYTPCSTNADGSANPGGMDAYRQGTPSDMNAQPGVQTYQDPDPQRSPAAPFGTPGLYAGTCGVYVNESSGSQSSITGLAGLPSPDPGYVVPGAC